MAIIVDKDGNVVTVENEPEEGRAMFPNLQDSIQDIIINGESIIINGVAYIPIASASAFGVVKIGNGIMIVDDAIRTDPALDNDIKNAANQYKPIAPLKQHRAAFYGLAKAAGDTTQAASSNAVGNYTDEAKTAIQKMLGLNPNKWELIYSDTVTNAEEADITIASDNNNQAFSLDDVIVYVHVPSQENDVHLGTYGSVYFYSSSTRVETAYLGEVTLTTSATRVGAARLIQKDGLMMCDYMQYATSNASVPWASHASVSPGSGGAPFRLQYSPITSVVIPTVLGTVNISVYGRKAVS